jgi:hypothetical protein
MHSALTLDPPSTVHVLARTDEPASASPNPLVMVTVVAGSTTPVPEHPRTSNAALKPLAKKPRGLATAAGRTSVVQIRRRFQVSVQGLVHSNAVFPKIVPRSQSLCPIRTSERRSWRKQRKLKVCPVSLFTVCTTRPHANTCKIIGAEVVVKDLLEAATTAQVLSRGRSARSPGEISFLKGCE